VAGEHRKGLTYSATLHLLILLFAIFGLPSFLRHKDPPQPMVIAVEILPISPITNVKPSEEPLAKEEKPAAKQPDPTPPTPPEPVKETPPPPEAVPEPKKEKPPEPKKEEKKEEKKPDPKKEEKPKKKEKSLEDVLKDLKKDKKQADQPKEKMPDDDSGTKVKAKQANYDPGMPMSMSELDAIRSQIAKCWSVPAGAKNAEDLQVNLRVQLSEDGTVLQVALADESKARYGSDSFYRAAADSAMRAVRQCSPLKNLPPEKYQTWRDIIMTFDPKEMLF
jgi:outer membrane biosynthesis protein TonB